MPTNAANSSLVGTFRHLFNLLLDDLEGLFKQILIAKELLSKLIRVRYVWLYLVRHQLADGALTQFLIFFTLSIKFHLCNLL